MPAPAKWVVPGAESPCSVPAPLSLSFSQLKLNFLSTSVPPSPLPYPTFYRKAPGRAVRLGVSECVPAPVCTRGMQKVMQRVSWMEPPLRPQEVSTIIGLSGSTDPLLQEALPDLPFLREKCRPSSRPRLPLPHLEARAGWVSVFPSMMASVPFSRIIPFSSGISDS